MDSVKINIPDGRKIVLTCTVVANIPYKKKYGVEEKLLTKVRTFKYDTGAQFTSLTAKELGIDISEQEFKDRYGTIVVECSGIDEKAKKINYYLIQVERFVINGINLGSVPIYITFDERVKKRLLGLDIIKLINTKFDFDNREATFSKTQSLIDFHKTKLRLEIQDMFKLGIYSNDDYEKDIDWQNILSFNNIQSTSCNQEILYDEQAAEALYISERIKNEGLN